MPAAIANLLGTNHTPAAPQPQQQQPQGNSGTAVVTPNNNPPINLNGPSDVDGNKNNPTDDMLSRLRSNQPVVDNSNPTGQQQVPPTTPAPPHQQPNTGDPSQTSNQHQQIVEQFFRMNPISDILGGVTSERISSALEAGDSEGVHTLLAEVAQNSVNQSMQAFLQLWPDLLEHAREVIREDVTSINNQNDHWNNFIQAHPDFKSARGVLEPQLRKALENGTPPDVTAFYDAFATLNHGYVSSPNQNNNQQPQDNFGKPFDFGQFIGT